MSYAAEVLSDSPVAYYQTAEASGLLQDSSGNGNHATATVGGGSCSYQEAGPILSASPNYAIKLNTPFAFTVPDHATLDVGDVFTLEYWVSFADFGVFADNILDKGAGAFGLGITLTGSDAVFDLSHRGVAVITTSSAIGGAGPTIWRHLVCTKDGADVHLYWDGVDVTGSITNSTIGNNTNVLNIGTTYDDKLSQIAIYPTALSQARVQAHYNAAFPVVPGRKYKRFYGPAQLPTSPTTLYTVP